MILLLLAALGCASTEPPDPADDDCTAPPNDRETPSDAALAAADSADQLGLALLQARTDANAFLGPLNIATALGMTLAGAAGDTREQMRATLAVEGDDADFHAGLAALDADLEGASADDEQSCTTWTFSGGNAAFLDTRLDLLDGYVATLADPYGVTPEVVDYASDADGAAAAINAWASDHTQGHVDAIADPEAFDAHTLLVLASAVYFQGKWAEPFDESLTRTDRFWLADGGARDVPLMSSTARRSWGRVAGAYVVEMPYRGDDLTMVLVVPDEIDGLDAVLEGLDPEAISAESLDASDEITVVMPRFEVRSHASLAALLAGLGMPDLFDRQLADLSAMAPPPPGFENLYVGDVVHEAWIRVEESGTDAAAATTVEVEGEDSAPPIPQEIRADRPFLYIVRDRVTGAWLFAGRMDDPSGE